MCWKFSICVYEFQCLNSPLPPTLLKCFPKWTLCLFSPVLSSFSCPITSQNCPFFSSYYSMSLYGNARTFLLNNVVSTCNLYYCVKGCLSLYEELLGAGRKIGTIWSSYLAAVCSGVLSSGKGRDFLEPFPTEDNFWINALIRFL